MKDARTLTSTFFAALFAVSLLASGCAGSLTGPQPDAAEKPVYQVDDKPGQQAGRNGGDGGSTTTGASHNTADS